MTLIASYITKFGIIQASDSNLSNSEGNAGFGQKVFPIPHLNASLSYSGVYSINGRSVDHWMTDFITASFFTLKTIEEFTVELKDRMNADMRENEIDGVTILHIAGYAKHDDQSHAEHWHISNTSLLESGSYGASSGEFKISNDFNSRTNPEQREFLKSFDAAPFNHQCYINGYPPGRMSANALKGTLDQTLQTIWNNKDWRFNQPETLFEFYTIVKLYFEFVKTLLKMSNYPALFIGGETQTHLIPVPQDLWKE